jgi:hypothetical protein
VLDIFEDGESYVCISHNSPIPCSSGDKHLVSNWPSDVAKVLDNIKSNDYNKN